MLPCISLESIIKVITINVDIAKNRSQVLDWIGSFFKRSSSSLILAIQWRLFIEENVNTHNAILHAEQNSWKNVAAEQHDFFIHPMKMTTSKLSCILYNKTNTELYTSSFRFFHSNWSNRWSGERRAYSIVFMKFFFSIFSASHRYEIS